MDYPGDDKAWCIRTCAKDGTSHGGFKWPSEIGAIVKCDDWDATPKCGNGLHGLLDGFGDYSMLSSEADAVWQIVLVDRNGCVEIDGKVKFASCELVFVGDMATAMTMMAKYQINLLLHAADASAASGSYSKLAASGSYSQLAASKDASQLAASGYASQLAASGDSSQLAASGDSSQLAASGDKSIAICCGLGSIAMAGNDGCIALTWLDKDSRHRVEVAYVGENGIKPNVYYRLSDEHKFEEVKNG